MTRGQQYQLLFSGAQAAARTWTVFVLLLSVILLGTSAWLSSQLVSKLYGFQRSGSNDYSTPSERTYNPFRPNCTHEKAADTKSPKSSPSSTPLQSGHLILPAKDCPSYFQLIHRDLAPWKERGITEQIIGMAKRRAAFRVVILEGKLYFEKYSECFGNRAMFTVWGLLLLLEKFKGQVPNLEFVFNCQDQPGIRKKGAPAVMFSYDTNHRHFDIPFPDWSFWGWSELMISSWDEKRETIINGSHKTNWELKAPAAYWRGNPYVAAPHRVELLKCHQANLTEIHPQNWREELQKKKENSKLEDQCTHKYMIYTEGNGWSVSLKYILSCGSPTLLIAPSTYDFFSRGLRQWVHYLPIRPSELRAPEMCDALEKGVEWAEANQTQAVQIGKAGQDFMRNEISMENVYNYMFHLLREYAQLLKFQPIQGRARLVTLDDVLGVAKPGIDRDTLRQTMKVMPINSVPCQISESAEKKLEEPDWEAI